MKPDQVSAVLSEIRGLRTEIVYFRVELHKLVLVLERIEKQGVGIRH